MIQHILLLALCRASTYKKHGLARVFSGVDDNGKQHSEPNLAADLRELDLGVEMQIPDDVHGGLKTIKLFLWVLCLGADMLGANSALPFTEGSMSTVPCRDCKWIRTSHDAFRPFSFLRRPPEGEQPRMQVKKWTDLKALLQRLRLAKLGDTELKKEYTKHGINKLYFALDPEYVPLIDPTKITAQDLLHLFPDGITRHELAWLINVLIALGLDLDHLNAGIRSYPDFPPDVRVPGVHASVADRKFGRPLPDATLRMSGSVIIHFALASVFILEPLLTAEMKAHPAWACWCKHAQLLSVCLQHELEVDDVKVIDDLQLEHARLFDAVPEYAGFQKPKHHFLVHLAPHTYRFGPLRGVWCFGFEHFNSVIKHAGVRTNFLNESLGIARFWSMRHALRSRRH